MVIVGMTALGQSKIHRVPLPKVPKGADDRCVYRPKYSPAKRLQFYPFNIADTIKLISFRHHLKNYPVSRDSVVKDSLLEVKVLQPQEVNQLTDILYNNFYKKFSGIGVLAQCFTPRNAILFIDKTGKLKESILICFHCNRYEVWSGTYNVFGNECDEKMEMIRKFFITQGVIFGTDRDVDSYPGETNKEEGIAAPMNNKAPL